VQKWHGEKGNSSGRFGSRKTVNHGRNWTSPAEMTHRAKMARRKGNIVRQKWTRAKAEWGIQKVRTRHEGRECEGYRQWTAAISKETRPEEAMTWKHGEILTRLSAKPRDWRLPNELPDLLLGCGR
jgi:hypothetical protein